MTRIITNTDELYYWSNCCGELFDKNTAATINDNELPSELHEIWFNLYEEGKFALSNYLVEYRNTYGIGLEAVIDHTYAADNNIDFDKAVEIMRQNTATILDTFPECSAFQYAEGSEIYFLIFIPYGCSTERFDEIGNFISQHIWEL